jgi:DNA-binding MarR family transcriptional regulator
MSDETLVDSDSDELDMTQIETGLAVLRKACDKAIDKLGGAVPGIQLRALLIFHDAGGSLDTRQLAAELSTSVSAAGQVCDRMQQAGLVTVEDTSSRGTLCCVLTDSGTRLARWIKDRQRMALSKVVHSLRPRARDSLIHGLAELAAVAPEAILS